MRTEEARRHLRVSAWGSGRLVAGSELIFSRPGEEFFIWQASGENEKTGLTTEAACRTRIVVLDHLATTSIVVRSGHFVEPSLPRTRRAPGEPDVFGEIQTGTGIRVEL